MNLRQLRQCGHDPDDIALARQQQEAARRAGGPARSLAEILAGKPARPRPAAAPSDLTARQLLRRGRYGQAALLADQAALAESDPARAEKAREASGTLKALARKPQVQFDFFEGNVTMGYEYHDAIRSRLIATGATPAERGVAHMVLSEVIRWLGWQSYECSRTAAEIGASLGLHKVVVSEALALLEGVGAITRIKRGRTKAITVTPEGAYRGNVQHHAEVVDRYRAKVTPLRASSGSDQR
jgi:DNA-binding transcriptional ArsR family regulator